MRDAWVDELVAELAEEACLRYRPDLVLMDMWRKYIGQNRNQQSAKCTGRMFNRKFAIGFT